MTMKDMAPKTMIEALLNGFNFYPQQTAIYYYDTQWSLHELVQQIEHVAGGLKVLGVKPKDRVAVMCQNMPAYVVVCFAIWALGGTVVPLNIMLKAEEIRKEIEDAGAMGIVALESSLLQIPEDVMLGRFGVSISDWQDFEGEAPHFLPRIQDSLDGPKTTTWTAYRDLWAFTPWTHDLWITGNPDDVALLTYTSGTTGPSKAAMNTHEQLLHSAHIYERLAQLNENDVNVVFAPLFHITGAVAGMAVSIRVRMPMVLLYRFDADVALKALIRHRGTFTVGAITTYLALLNHSHIEDVDLSHFAKAYSGGAPVASAVVERFEKVTGCYIYNVYGLTESANGIVITPWGERAPVDPDSGALSVGKVGPGISAEIRNLEDRNHVLEANRVGELVLQGPSITRGYWQKPEETHHAFLDGWFFTGDVAKIDEAGWIYIIDRKKDLIITSGNKVWPRDVEDALYLHPAVKQVSVVGLPDSYRGEAVTAFIVVKDGFHPSEEELIVFARERLATYKVPRRIIWVDEIPTTPTGKFLRRYLREKFGGMLA